MIDAMIRLEKALKPHIPRLDVLHAPATDAGIDALVYELYGMTEEEIAIVEGRER